MNIITFLFIGLIAGWIATTITEGHGLGFFRDIVIGVVGAFVGGFILNFFGFMEYGFWGSVGTSVIGAVVFLYIIGLFTNHSKQIPIIKS